TDVRAGDERLLAGAGHHDPAHVGVLREGAECPVDFRHGLGVQRVELVRTVDREGRDALAPLDRYEAVRISLCHDGSPSIRIGGSRVAAARKILGGARGAMPTAPARAPPRPRAPRPPPQVGVVEPRTTPSTIRFGSK